MFSCFDFRPIEVDIDTRKSKGSYLNIKIVRVVTTRETKLIALRLFFFHFIEVNQFFNNIYHVRF